MLVEVRMLGCVLSVTVIVLRIQGIVHTTMVQPENMVLFTIIRQLNTIDVCRHMPSTARRSVGDATG